MSARSNVRKLDKSIQKEINRLLGEGQTLDGILAHLRLLGIETVSRSGLGRHALLIKKAAERQARAEAIAEQFTRNVRDSAHSNIVRGAVESLGGMIALALEQADGESINPKDFQALGRALESLGKAKNMDIAAALKVEEQKAKEDEARLAEEASADNAAGRIEIVFVEAEK
jgi:hypothetical protein